MTTASTSNNPVVVFGGTGGLGTAVVKRFCDSGRRVIVGDRLIPDSATRLPGASYEIVDALDEESVRSFFAALEPSPWGVVNLIGGYAPGQPIAELDISVLRNQLELNVVSAAVITKYAITSIGGRKGGGRIVHTSSRVARQDGAGGFAYSVSKLAVTRLVEAAAAETKELGITVNCVMPSIIDSAANRSSMPNADFSRWPKPEEIAAVLDFLISDDAVLISGAAIPVYGKA